MKGIFTGLALTFNHMLRRKVTRFYPYEKRQLPERSRGLIKLVRNDFNGNYNCEACLFCEKICPPQCITIKFSPADDYRTRPWKAKNGSWLNYKRPVRALLSQEGRPDKFAGQAGLPAAVSAAVDAVIAAAPRGRDGLTGALQGIQDSAGYLPRAALEQFAQSNDVPLSDVYGAATAAAGLRLEPVTGVSIAVCQCPACYAEGASAVAAALRQELGPKASESLKEEVICDDAGCWETCATAPVVKLDGRTYRGVSPAQIQHIVQEKGLGGGARQ